MNKNIVRYKVFGSFALFENINKFINEHKDKINIVTTVYGDNYTAVYYQWNDNHSDTNPENSKYKL